LLQRVANRVISLGLEPAELMENVAHLRALQARLQQEHERGEKTPQPERIVKVPEFRLSPKQKRVLQAHVLAMQNTLNEFDHVIDETSRATARNDAPVF
jgi:hypothetical protein